MNVVGTCEITVDFFLFLIEAHFLLSVLCSATKSPSVSLSLCRKQENTWMTESKEKKKYANESEALCAGVSVCVSTAPFALYRYTVCVHVGKTLLSK